jgi:hypothetical protein
MFVLEPKEGEWVGGKWGRKGSWRKGRVRGLGPRL